MDNKDKLRAVYHIYGQRVADYPYACSKGCASCCTQSVTMTSLEGEIVLDFLAENDIKIPAAHLAAGARPACTTNEFAGRCLAEEDLAEEEDFWSFTPCLFLADGACTIYPARPFGCRSFGSFVRCDEAGEAELEPFLITLNTVTTQIIEHLSQGGLWGNMFDVLLFGQAEQEKQESKSAELRRRLLTAKPLPGFLVPPAEMAAIREFGQSLSGLDIAGIGGW